MQSYKYVILGAGPSGLGFAHTLKSLGEDSFLVLEKESVAGGLCRSVMMDGAPVDTGGGHFIEFRQPEVAGLLLGFMPRREWNEFSRISLINLRGTSLDYPLEANLWQLPMEDQVFFLESIAQAGCVRGVEMPESFSEWIRWKLGDLIADEYMLPYNRKIWSVELDRLGTYWLHKLPDVSFRQTLQSCLERRPLGTLPGHGVFLYPKHYGSGELWRRMGEALGGQLLTNTPVTSIDIERHVINGMFRAEKIVTTIPWPLWPNMSEVPAAVRGAIEQLAHAAIDIDYFPETMDTEAHWIYEPDERLSYHRILCRSNFAKGSRGYWTETNSGRSLATDGWRCHNEFAYPLSTVEKPAVMSVVNGWALNSGILPLGRWGRWEHVNSDIAVFDGITTARELLAVERA